MHVTFVPCCVLAMSFIPSILVPSNGNWNESPVSRGLPCLCFHFLPPFFFFLVTRLKVGLHFYAWWYSQVQVIFFFSPPKFQNAQDWYRFPLKLREGKYKMTSVAPFFPWQVSVRASFLVPLSIMSLLLIIICLSKELDSFKLLQVSPSGSKDTLLFRLYLFIYLFINYH